MRDKIEFQKLLLKLIKNIEETKKEVTEETVQEYLSAMNLTSEQVEMVIEYVKIKQEEHKLSQEEVFYLEEYQETLSFLKPEKEGEKVHLLQAIATGMREAEERLVELYLLEVVELARAVKVQGVLIEDLIQEGNLGVTLGIREWQEKLTESYLQKSVEEIKHFDNMLLENARNMMESYISENTKHKKKDSEVLQKVLELDECLTRLEKKFGRKVMIDELADEMKLEEDEVLDIIKLAGENLDKGNEE